MTFPRKLLLAFVAVSLSVLTARAADAPPISAAEYAQRRASVRANIGNGLVVLFGNVEAEGPSAFHAFHQESSFLYLTGFDLPGAMLLLGPAEKDGPGFTEIGRAHV